MNKLVMAAVILLIAGGTYTVLYGVVVFPKVSSTATSSNASASTVQVVQGALTRYDEKGYIDASTIWAIQGYWTAAGLNASENGVDPVNYHVFEFFMDVHFGALPGSMGGPLPPNWYNVTSLQVVSRVGGGNVTKYYAPSIVKPLLLDMHHSIWMFEFAKTQPDGTTTIPDTAKEVTVITTGIEGPSDVKHFAYTLPLQMSEQASSALFPGSNPLAGTAMAGVITAFPLLGGVIVYMSPCFMELTTVYVAMISGVKVSEVVDGKSGKGFRARIIGSTLLFVTGISVVYAGAGALVGYTGSLLKAFPSFQPFLIPMQLLGGGMFIYLGVMTSGVLPRLLPQVGWLKNAPFLPRVNQSCRTGGSFIIGLTFGGVQCFRGALVMAMLFLAFTLSSPILGALVMFVLAMAFGIPFVAIGFLASNSRLLGKLTPSSNKAFRIGVTLFLVFLGALTIVSNVYVMNPLLEMLYYPVYSLVHGLLPGLPLPPPTPIVPP